MATVGLSPAGVEKEPESKLRNCLLAMIYPPVEAIVQVIGSLRFSQRQDKRPRRDDWTGRSRQIFPVRGARSGEANSQRQLSS